MRITLQLPTSTAIMDVGDDALVFNGEAYVKPAHALYVELYTLPVTALSSPSFIGQHGLSLLLSAAVRIKAKVIGLDPTVVPATDPAIVHVEDPSGGECVCGITCSGTNIRFAVVQPEN